MPGPWRRRPERLGGVVLRPYVLFPLWLLATVLATVLTGGPAAFVVGVAAYALLLFRLRVRAHPAGVSASEEGLVLTSPGVLTGPVTVPWGAVADARRLTTHSRWTRGPVGHRVLGPSRGRPDLAVTFRRPVPLPGRLTNRLDPFQNGQYHRQPWAPDEPALGVLLDVDRPEALAAQIRDRVSASGRAPAPPPRRE